MNWLMCCLFSSTAEETSPQMQKDLPFQFLHSSKPIDVRFVIASFGPVKGYNNPAFQIAIERDMNVPLPSSKVVRYGKLDEIHHIFKPDPTSPPVIVSLVFVAAVLAALPALAGVVSSLQTQLSTQL